MRLRDTEAESFGKAACLEDVGDSRGTTERELRRDEEEREMKPRTRYLDMKDVLSAAFTLG